MLLSLAKVLSELWLPDGTLIGSPMLQVKLTIVSESVWPPEVAKNVPEAEKIRHQFVDNQAR